MKKIKDLYGDIRNCTFVVSEYPVIIVGILFSAIYMLSVYKATNIVMAASLLAFFGMVDTAARAFASHIAHVSPAKLYKSIIFIDLLILGSMAIYYFDPVLMVYVDAVLFPLRILLSQAYGTEVSAYITDMYGRRIATSSDYLGAWIGSVVTVLVFLLVLLLEVIFGEAVGLDELAPLITTAILLGLTRTVFQVRFYRINKMELELIQSSRDL